MKPGIIVAALAAAAAIAIGVYMVDVEMTQDGSLPDVDVSVESGTLPEYDVQTGDVDVGSEQVEVTVPTLNVETPEEENDASASIN